MKNLKVRIITECRDCPAGSGHTRSESRLRFLLARGSRSRPTALKALWRAAAARGRAASVKGRGHTGPRPPAASAPRPRGLTLRAQLRKGHVLGKHSPKAPQPRHDPLVQRPVLASAADTPAEVQGPTASVTRLPWLPALPRAG